MSTSKNSKSCFQCQSFDIVVSCASENCDHAFCQVCAKLDKTGAIEEGWICEQCEAFYRSQRTLRSGSKLKPSKVLLPRKLKYDENKTAEAVKIQSEKKGNNDENEMLKLELEETKKQLELIQLQIKVQEKHETGRSDNVLSPESLIPTADLNAEAKSFVPERTHNAAYIEPKEDDPAANIARYLADAIRMLQPNVPVNPVHNGFDPDEQLKLTMIRASLPELPTFSGALEEWPLFERIYRTTSETGKYTEELNHLRLMKCLDGDAKVECQRLLSGMAGGTAIMDHLKTVYGDPEKILSRQVKHLLKMKAPKELEKYQLKEFVNELESFVINAESLKRSDFLSQPSIIDQLVFKLRDRHRDAWGAMKLANPNVNLKDLCKYLSERLKDASAQPPSESYHFRNRDSRRMHTHREEKTNCIKCKAQSHDLQYCSDFKKLMLTDKKKFVRVNGLCNCCLKQGHRWKDCKTKRMCNLDGCKEFHHRVLHWKLSTNQSNQDAEDETKQMKSNRRSGSSSSHSKKDSCVDTESSNYHKSSSVMYKILPVVLHGKNGEAIETYAFLDDGSSVTLLDKELYTKLNVKGRQRPLNLRWTSGICREESESYIFDCQISRGLKGKKYPLFGVRSVDQLDLASQTVVAAELQERFKHLKGIPIPSFDNVQPKLLIGLKNVSFLTSLSSVIGADDEPVAVKTKLGWTVFGATSDSLEICAVHEMFDNERLMAIRCDEESDESLHELVKSYFAVESIGTTKYQPMSADDMKVMEVIEKTMKHDGERYEVGFPWRNLAAELPNNKPMAMKRLINLEKSLERTPELKRWTIEKFQELQEKGYVRKANDRDLSTECKRKWILPTFTVINENKIPIKPRQVYDAAAKYKGVSLNSELLSGPDLLIPLNAGLYKFREEKVCVTADVTEMYNQIKLIETDQQCQRLLWRNCDQSREPELFIFTRLSFGPTCAPAIAQAVKNIHAEKYREEYPEAVDGLINRTFMDDYFNSHATVEDAVRVSKNAVKIMKEAGFELCKFQSNSKEFLKLMPQEKVKNEIVSLEPVLESVTKVLGMYWDTQSDCFTYRLHEEHFQQELATHENMPTKRQMLRLVMKIFDPLGLISHFTIRGKILLQEVWKDGTQWDAPIDAKLLSLWLEWIKELKGIVRLKIPRQYASIDMSGTKIELHVFMDASERAYASCAYLRIETEKEIHVVLVGAKAKVVPLKVVSIPRCELLAATIGTRLSKTIQELHSIKIDEVTYWSDSKCVLLWINSDELRFKQFVAVRINEILETTTRAEWRYVPSKLNVADDATKCNETEIKDSSRWFNGPEFLKKSNDEWPKSAKIVPDEEQVLLQIEIVNEQLEDIDDVIERISPQYKAKWRSMVRVIAWMLKCRESNGFLLGSLSAAELKKAELKIFRKIQRESYGSEINSLKEKGIVEKESKLYQLCPFIGDDDVIRMQGRNQNAFTSYASKNPIILPNNHELVRIFLQFIHEKRLHIGEESIIAEARKSVWIVNVRAAVRRIKRECQRCMNTKAEKKTTKPQMGLLPEYRFQIGVKPFTHVGIDCFGPLEVAVKRSREKRYGMIFCCMVSRAVHIELLQGMDTDSCMMAIMSFLTLRGPSKFFYSDNGKNFQGSNNVMKRELNQMRFKLGEQIADKYRIDWFFNPPWAPHFGGVYERMIQSIKLAVNAMANTMKPRVPSEPVLRAALMESIGIMNSRPLTHTPVDAEDDMPLTPNDILGQSNLKTIPGLGNEENNYCKALYRRAQHLTNVFTKRWVDAYLPILSKRCKWFEKSKPIEEGDIVIIINPTMARCLWKKGRVVKVYKGKDDQVRVVDVKTADGKIKKRAVHYLAVLEIKGKEFSPAEQDKTEGSMSSTENNTA